MKEYTKNQVHEVACAFNEHKIIALPTDTVYGVGVKYGNLEDLERLKRAKHRPETKPIPMMVSNVEQMKQVALVDERIEKIAAKFLPGALTLVVNVKDSVDSAYTNGLSTIAIRIPDEKFILDVIDELNCPILVTSANQSGEKTACHPDVEWWRRFARFATRRRRSQTLAWLQTPRTETDRSGSAQAAF